MIYFFLTLVEGAIIPNVPCFLYNIQAVSDTAFPAWISNLYNYAWFVGFIISGACYWLLLRKK